MSTRSIGTRDERRGRRARGGEVRCCYSGEKIAGRPGSEDANRTLKFLDASRSHAASVSAAATASETASETAPVELDAGGDRRRRVRARRTVHGDQGGAVPRRRRARRAARRAQSGDATRQIVPDRVQRRRHVLIAPPARVRLRHRATSVARVATGARRGASDRSRRASRALELARAKMRCFMSDARTMARVGPG